MKERLPARTKSKSNGKPEINVVTEINELLSAEIATYKTREYQNRITELLKRQALRNVGPGGWSILNRVCDICRKRLPSAQHLVRHRLTHTSDLKHSCLICYKKYNHKCSLMRHSTSIHGAQPAPTRKCRQSFGSANKHGKRRHKCRLCKAAFKTAALLKQHRGLHDCSICFKTFTEPGNRKAHELIHQGEATKKHECHICHLRVRTTAKLTQHMRTHTGEKPYKCTECKSRFSRNGAKNLHIRLHHGTLQDRKPYQCDLCPKAFSVSTTLKEHRVIHAGAPGQYKCDLCDRRFHYVSSLQNHIVAHGDERRHVCDIDSCTKRFKFGTGLQQHKRTHHNIGVMQKNHECDFCHKLFRYKYQLAQHMRYHTGERNYNCERCDKRFVTKSHLTEHQNVHDAREKTFECKLCNKRYHQPGLLKTHITVRHMDEKSKECKICHKRFQSNFILLMHTRTHTGEKPFPCAVCSRRFTVPSARKKHMIARHSDRTRDYECDVCKVRFYTVVLRNDHRRRHALEGRHECVVCYKLCASAGHVRKHTERVHDANSRSNNKFKCDICGLMFKKRDDIVQHLEFEHT